MAGMLIDGVPTTRYMQILPTYKHQVEAFKREEGRLPKTEAELKIWLHEIKNESRK